MKIPFTNIEIIRRRKDAPASLSSVSSSRGWWPLIQEPFAGAWQRGQEINTTDVLAFYAVYACVTRIATDIGKMRVTLVEQDRNGIWSETENPAYSPVLRTPNHFQTSNQFFESWMQSKLIHGNTYVLLKRDNRRVVDGMYVLDPQRAKPLVAPNGDVYYALQQDALTQVPDSQVIVPASEIIHDRMATFYHPLCGVSPISACGLAAMQGLHMQRNSSNFFANGSQPGGLITAPGPISEADAKMIRDTWESEYSGANAGRVAVLGNGLAYHQMTVNAVDAELIEQMKMSAESVCSVYHVPPFMVGVAPAPPYTNVEALLLMYHAQTLQGPVEHIESLLDAGLNTGKSLGVEFDTDSLVRMDTPTQIKAAAEGIGGGGMSPDEARKRFLHLGPVAGGSTPYLQQQNFSLEALAKRDAQPDPFGTATPKPQPESRPLPAADADDKAVTLSQFNKYMHEQFDARFVA